MKHYSLVQILLPAVFCMCMAGHTAAQEQGENEGNGGEHGFLSEAVALGIETADYYELLAWTRRLDLSEKGTVQDLRAKLYEYYSAVPPAEEEDGRQRAIRIESANSTEYFTISEIEERYIVIEGDVVLVLDDPEKNSSHTIRADRIVFNQDTNQLSAEGGVEYTLQKEDRTDIFNGDKLTFNIETWEGIFFEGYSETEREVEGEQLRFRFSGEDIHRSEDNIITLNRGSITSSKTKDPYYRIKARKIWVLAPGEWAIVNASLYIGRVPVFYIPFFFKNGDKLFFNPSMGFSTEKGFFFQTTTYFLGTKDKSEEPVSFLQLGETEEEEIKKIRGLYLREAENITPRDRREFEYTRSSGAYGKVLLDFYSRLGLFAGIELNLKDLSVLENAALFAGIARSRDIYLDPSLGWYTPFWETSPGTVASRWNDGFLFEAVVPFRYGLTFDISLGHKIFDLDAAFDFYSDPYFRRDFLDRSEDVPWGELLGFTDTGTTGLGSDAPGSISRLNWMLRTGLRVPTEKTAPYLSTAAVRKLETSLTWKTKETDTSGVPGLDPSLPGYVNPAYRTDYSFPLQRFFYPDSLQLPGVSMEISGTVFDSSRNTKRKSEPGPSDAETAEEHQGKDIIPPAGRSGTDTDAADTPVEENGTSMRRAIPEKPKRRPSAALPRKPVPEVYNHNFRYRILPSLDLDSRFDSGAWVRPEDVDYSIEYSLLDTRGSLSLNYAGSVYNGIFSIQDTVTLSGHFRNHFNRGNSITDSAWGTLEETDYKNTEFTIENNLVLKSMPFSAGWYLEKSYISYTLKTLLFKRDYLDLDPSGAPIFINRLPEWDKEYITAHSAELVLLPFFAGNEQKCKLSYTMPPLNQEFASETVITTGPLVSQLNWEFGQYYLDPQNPGTSPVEWRAQPVRLLETLKIQEFLVLKQLFSYSIRYGSFKTSETTLTLSFFEQQLKASQRITFGETEEESLAVPVFLYANPFQWTSTLDVWWFHLQFSMRRGSPYSFSQVSGWVEEAGEVFQPERFKAWFDYSKDFDPIWKNRIDLSLDVSTTWNMDFIRFTNSSWTFDLGFTVKVYKFFDISVTLSSENREIFRYFKGYSDTVGVEQVNPITDVLKSFNVFNMQHRRESFFNAKRATIRAVHDLRDWDLTFEYVGEPKLTENTAGYKFYEWSSSFSIFIKWNPIPEIKREIIYENKELRY